MKRVTPIFAVTLLLTASALWFVSCASEPVNSPLPPVTALKSEPVSATDSSEIAPVISTAPSSEPAPAVSTDQQEALKYSSKPLITAVVPASPAVQPQPAAAAVVMVSATPPPANSLWDNRWWPWLLLLLALLVLIKATKPLRTRTPNPQKLAEELAAAQKTGVNDEGLFVQGAGAVVLAKKAHWVPLMNPHSGEKEITVTAFFKGQEHKMHFSPATTVKKITAWAAYQCGIFDLNTTEVYLAIRGYSAPLTGTAHIGRFIMRDKHHLDLDVLTFAKNATLSAETALAQNPELAEDELWVEGAGMAEPVKISVKPNTPAHEVIGSVARIAKFPPDKAFLFLENESVPLDPNHLLDAKHPRHVVHHVHTQMEIAVTVFHNGREHKMHFSPATTVKKVTAWATYQFEIFDQDSTEVYLAIHNYSAPLSGAAHIGRFVEHDKKNLELDVLTFTKAKV